MGRFDRRLTEFETELDYVRDDIHTIKARMTAVEENLVGINRRLNRHEERLERRPDLIDTAT
jgi:hypothetical protein